MRSAPILDAGLRAHRRELLLGGFTLALAAVGLAALAAVALIGGGATARLPGVGGGDRSVAGGPTLLATGVGEARAPAASALLHLLISRDDFDGGMIDDSNALDGSSTAGGSEPGAAEHAAVEPIVQALVANGLPADAVTVVVSPAFAQSYYGPTPSFGVRLDIVVADPDIDGLNRLVNAAAAAATEADLIVVDVDARYDAADCAALARAAREQAIAAARANAEQQADLLLLPLGDLLLASDAPTTDSATGPDSCHRSSGPANEPNLFGDRSSLPPFDPMAPAEAVTRVGVSLSYAVG